MSTMQSPPPEQPVPAGPPDRRCPRCGSVLAADQEWCLACGAAAGTEVVEARGWRVPIYLGGGLVALAVLGVVLAIAALSSDKEQQNPTPTPQASAAPTSAAPAPTTSTLPTITPIPTTGVGPTDTATAVPTESAVPTETATASPTTDGTTSGTISTPSTNYPTWTGTDGDYTIIIESATSVSKAEGVAKTAQDGGKSPGILNSDDFSSLNGGYYVVFVGDYSSKKDAQAALSDVQSDFSDAYVKQIKQ
jgi:septal ring-binding cell division protein DamX